MSNRAEFLNKLADLMEEHGVVSFDSNDSGGSYCTNNELEIEFDKGESIEVILYAYPDSFRRAAKSQAGDN